MRINKSLFFKLQKAKENVEAKYRLWKEQEYCCLYTGRMIGITDLFQENSIDFEHTIPRSRSLDNSLANLTICDAKFNRDTKKNKIPTELDNYNKEAYGYNGSIKSRLERWEQKVKDLKLRVDFWKAQSKRATTKDAKDKAIQQRHLWQFELDYWHDKVSRFTMEEVKSSFRKSQLVDTQIISKYAFHFLKTFFNTVEVQKGGITAEFRKIFGVQEIGTKKDRSKHSHHAKDAIVLTLIPSPAIREQMLTVWYEIQETKDLLLSNTEPDKNKIQEEIYRLEETLRLLKYQCNLPNVNAVLDKMDERILINNIPKDNALVSANRRVRSRGKVVPAKDKDDKIIYQTDENRNLIHRKHKDGNLVWKVDEKGNYKLDGNGNKIPVYLVKEKWAKGDAIRGQLHLDTFYGRIKVVEKDENGKFKRDEQQNFIYELDKKQNELSYKTVLRKELNKDFDVEKIVDPQLKFIVKKQMKGRTIGATINEDGGIFMLRKDGSKANKMRHIRCFANDVTNPVAVKKQTFQHESNNEKHKNFYWAKNGENIVCALYQKTINDKAGKEKPERELEIITLKDAAALLSLELIDENREIELYQKDKKEKEVLDENGNKIKPYALLKPGMKVIFYNTDSEKISDLENMDIKTISNRMYKILKFSGTRITFEYHLDARSSTDITKEAAKLGEKSYATGYSKINFENPAPRLLLSKDSLNMAIERKHFEIKPDGEIKWI